MQHPWRDDYWKHGSVCEDYSAIEVPVYAIGGWADGYSNAIPRLLEHLTCPRKGLIGPWAHNFPHDGVPGPAIGYLQEAVRWWDHWLKGRDTGIMDEPMVRAWMQESVLPAPQYAERPGRWVAEDDWPSTRIVTRRWYLGTGYLSDTPCPLQALSFASPETTGVRSGEWCAFGADGEMPRDQRPDDGGSLLFDSDPLEADIEILGSPEIELELSANEPVAFVVARLCDVEPDGSSLRVSYGVLNLTHRDSHEFPEPLEPGRRYRVTLRLDAAAHGFPAGHRIRLALSTNYWPIIWPAPRPVRLTVHTGETAIHLPVRPPWHRDSELRPFEPPVAAPGSTSRKLVHLPMRRSIEIDLASNEMVYTLKSDGGELDGAALARFEDIDLEVGHQLTKRFRILEGDPASAQTELHQRTEFRRGDWRLRLWCLTRLSATTEHFQFSCDLEAWEGDRQVRERSWTVAIPRKLL
jgi:hypothetical protein